MSTITATQFDLLRDLVLKESAIVLEPGKEYLVESRLAPIARREGLGSVADLVQRLITAPSVKLKSEIIDAMTTNETSFFRDVHPWQTLKEEVLPKLIEARRIERRLTVWCAAASSGFLPLGMPPRKKNTEGTFWAKKPKSSAPVIGLRSTTFVSPAASRREGSARAISAGLL